MFCGKFKNCMNYSFIPFYPSNVKLKQRRNYHWVIFDCGVFVQQGTDVDTWAVTIITLKWTFEIFYIMYCCVIENDRVGIGNLFLEKLHTMFQMWTKTIMWGPFIN